MPSPASVLKRAGKAAASLLWGRGGPQDKHPDGRFPGNGMVIGLEYFLADNDRLRDLLLETFVETGLPATKPLPENYRWGEMQKGPGCVIDFRRLDNYVRKAQQERYTEITLALKSHSNWASRGDGGRTNAAPKEQHEGAYAHWVGEVVERYDMDGDRDMPGLKWPIKYYEIGSEFSSFEPESVEEYLHMLSLAYSAAHGAYPDVVVTHAAFLVTPVDLNVDHPDNYTTVWQTTTRHDTYHDIADQRKILDRPDLFDVINFHNLGYPYEIEHVVTWLQYEMAQRGYTKDIIVSDTVPTSYIGWGPANTCDPSKPRGLVGLPATESDRCRLAAFFTKLIDGDGSTLDWTRGFVAADHVQRTIVAAEQGIKLINLSFTLDIVIATLPFFQGGAGIGAWGGALEANIGCTDIQNRYPLFYSLKQMLGHINAYDSIQRLDVGNAQGRVYQLVRNGSTLWVAWYDPQMALLPEDGTPSLQITFSVGTFTAARLEKVITGMGQTEPFRASLTVSSGNVTFDVTHTPVYVFGSATRSTNDMHYLRKQ